MGDLVLSLDGELIPARLVLFIGEQCVDIYASTSEAFSALESAASCEYLRAARNPGLPGRSVSLRLLSETVALALFVESR